MAEKINKAIQYIFIAVFSLMAVLQAFAQIGSELGWQAAIDIKNFVTENASYMTTFLTSGLGAFLMTIMGLKKDNNVIVTENQTTNSNVASFVQESKKENEVLMTQNTEIKEEIVALKSENLEQRKTIERVAGQMGVLYNLSKYLYAEKSNDPAFKENFLIMERAFTAEQAREEAEKTATFLEEKKQKAQADVLAQKRLIISRRK
jgi:hypothetical protein